MARRKPYTKVEKRGQRRPDHVRGLGDVLFRGFQCLSSRCQEFIVVREDDVDADFQIACPACKFIHQAGGETKFFDYALVRRTDGEVIEEGEFAILHDDYIGQAQRLKYCLLCYTRKPLDHFDRHQSRQSGRQGECRLCKTIYNNIKNQSRITDQYRENAARRRLYRLLAQEAGKIDSRVIFKKFGGTCFRCGRKLRHSAKGQGAFQLDHTLPARLLWPLTTENATLLCTQCNNEKHDRWPSEIFNAQQLRRLARLTGYEYALLAGEPQVNDHAVERIFEDPDAFIEEWIGYPKEIKKVRRMILDYANVDIFKNATLVPDYLKEDGDSRR